MPPPIQRMRADDLLAAVFPDQAACGENIVGDIRIPDHPLVNETMRDCLTEAMDVERLKDILGRMERGEIELIAIDTAEPSPFTHEILNANPYAYLDDAPLEERRARAVELRRVLPESVLSEVGRLDPAAIEEVARDAWPDVRDADDLADALQTLVLLPARDGAMWQQAFDGLAAARRAAVVQAGDRDYWVAAERAHLLPVLLDDARSQAPLPDLGLAPVARGEALFDAAPEPKRMLILDGAGHNDIWSERVLREIEGFVDEVSVP